MGQITASRGGYKYPYLGFNLFFDNYAFYFVDELRKLLSAVNWARAGLGLPLLEEQVEKRPTFTAVPSGPRPTPEGESVSAGASMSDGIQSVGAAGTITGSYR